ncbi:MAG: flagellar motor switch protein FliN [Desulfatiglandaceae bacterium]|jgi:flagellar motor switch protein FliN
MNEQNENNSETQTAKEEVSPENVDFAEIEPGLKGTESSQSIDFLLDVPLEITVELGRTRIQIGDLLKLGQGSVVELEKLTNEPVDIYINQKLMGHGEVVVVNEKFAIRLTNIVSPGERVKNLT